MLLTNGQYRLGIVIEHNTSPPEAGAGSCVFMHIWLGPGIGTSGCTAMQEGDIETLLAWIDSRAHPDPGATARSRISPAAKAVASAGHAGL